MITKIEVLPVFVLLIFPHPSSAVQTFSLSILTCRSGNCPMNADHNMTSRRGLGGSHNGNGSVPRDHISPPKRNLKRLKLFTFIETTILISFANKNEYCIKSNLQAIKRTTGVSLPLISSIGSPVRADFLE